ncbi:MAG: hypothetical protein U1F44_05190 [Coriobacteriia bacterium]|nr:hypothetical protein [Coriobacteriia bacterium]
MNDITHIGLDVHKDTIAVAVFRPGTTEVDERVTPNTPEAVRRLLRRYPDPSALRVCYEAGPTASTHATSRVFAGPVARINCDTEDRTPQVRALAMTAASAYFTFETGEVADKRWVLATVLSNATVEEGRIVSYQLKHPFEYLRRDPKGVFCHSWWAMRGAFVAE